MQDRRLGERGPTYHLGFLLGREVGVWVGGHVYRVVVVAAISIAGCLLLVAAHVGHFRVERLLGVQDTECLGSNDARQLPGEEMDATRGASAGPKKRERG